jgi:hypothetical protein
MKRNIRISKQILRDYEKLVSEISEINGMIYHHKSIIKTYSSQIKNLYKKRSLDFVLGNHFNYRSPHDGKFIWGDFYTVDKKNFSSKVQIISRKVSNYYVAIGYEYFEKFLRSISARIIINNKKLVEDENPRLGFNSYKSCLFHLQDKYKNNLDLVHLLKNINPELKRSFEKEKGLKNFLNFYTVYSICRNHTIHSNDFIDVKIFKAGDPVNKEFAVRYFGIELDKKQTKYLIDTTDTYDETLKTIVSFAYLIISSFDSTFIK